MNPNAISIDCEVTLTEDVTNFTLRATLSDATQSPHSVQSTYNQTEGGSLNFVWGRSIHVEWGYTPPNEPEVTGFQLYQEGNASCFWEGADTNAGDCTVVLTAEITNFTLTATFSDGTESPHSAPFAFNPDDAASGDDGDTTNPFIRMIITKHWHQFRKTGSKPVRYGTGKLGARFR
jgi:hypothetical protein